MSEVLLAAEALDVTYPLPRGERLKAVSQVSLALHAGETLSLVGESGCGKSTLARALLCLEPASGGRVVAFGQTVSGKKEKHLQALRRRTAMVFQDPFSSFDPRMRVGEAVAEPLVIHGVGDREARRLRVEALFSRVGLPQAAMERYPHAFSGGQLQRVAIARALALSPDVVVADEAVSALDVSVRAGVLNLLAELQRETGLAYLFVAHDLTLVQRISHRVAVMYLGRVVELASVDALFARPAHPYTQALLASVPVADPTRRQAPPALLGEPPSPLNPPTGCPFHPRCPKAVPECAKTRPPLAPVGPDHQAACPLVSPYGS